MRFLSPLPAFTSHPHRTDELLTAGIPKWRIYATDFDHPTRGVATRRPQDPTFRRLVEAVSLVLKPGQFFSRRTAMRLHGAPVRDDPSDHTVDVGTITPGRAPRRPQVAGHRLRPGALLDLPVAPFWLPSPEESWCLLAAVASRAELLAAGDFLVSGPSRWDRPLSTIAALTEASARFRHCAGAVLRREVLPLVRCGVESPAETALRLIIIDAGFAEPLIQCPVRVRGRVLHADLGYPRLRIAFEYEGAHHFGSNAVEQARRDIARVRAMEAARWKVLRVMAHDLSDPRAFLFELSQALVAAEATDPRLAE
ncbi:MAG: hypothetical protein KDB25_00960 [Leucobacter sp.]|nr:hypothetical protein [Leucobacter sp.]